MKTAKTIFPRTTALNEGNAYWMARLAAVAYIRKSAGNAAPDAKKILANLKKEDSDFEAVTGYSQNSAQAILVQHRRYFCMAFRGTDETADWLDSLKFSAVSRLFGKFHRGFWQATQDIWQPLHNDYKAVHKTHPRPLFITGHSLGGAMATVVAAKLIHNSSTVPFTACYTFGQPRAMKEDTAEQMNALCKKRFFRFQNCSDIVTRVPTRVGGYGHTGTCVYLDRDGHYTTRAGVWKKILSFIIVGTIETAIRFKPKMLTDHKMQNYLAPIKKWQKMPAQKPIRDPRLSHITNK